jgi:hypothetical protein
MKHITQVFTVFLTILAIKVYAVNYSDFHSLSDRQKEIIVWNLFDKKEFGKPEHKPICKELLATQGRFANANAISFTYAALDAVEKYKWQDLKGLVKNIYDHPDNIWLHEKSFQCLRGLQKKPVSSDIIENTRTLSKAGSYIFAITDAQLNSAKRYLINAADHEAVLVYSITVAGQHFGKGGTLRGCIAAAEVIKTIDKKMVLTSLKKLHGKNEVDWLINYMKLDVKGTKQGSQ